MNDKRLARRNTRCCPLYASVPGWSKHPMIEVRGVRTLRCHGPRKKGGPSIFTLAAIAGGLAVR